MIRLCQFLILCFVFVLPTQASEPISFDFEVLPTLTRAGCNSGSCHGAAAGRGGFHLSLWGSTPQADYLAIAREFEGRRIDIKQPTESLLLKKPTGSLDHEGGAILDEDSAAWQILYDWIKQGGLRSGKNELKRLELQFHRETIPPQSATTLPVHTPGTLDVQGYFHASGPINLNSLVTVTLPDPSSLRFDYDTMQLTALRPGIHSLIVRYGDQVRTLQILTPHPTASTVPISAQPSSRLEPSNARNVIDDWLDQRRELLGQIAAPRADDATMLRRVMLDLVGRAPNSEELHDYLGSSAIDKYEHLVDRLLSTPEFIDFSTYRWTRLWGLRPNHNAPQGLHHFYQWLREQIATSRPWDQVTRDMLTATGDCHETSPAFFMLLANDPRQQAEQISHWFIGARMECANCHDHPLDHWKQDDYHGLAAVFARIDRKQVVRWLQRGAVTNPRTGLPAIAKIPGGTGFSSGGDVRSELAQWIIAQPEGLLARTTVNRVWSHFFGRGLVEPVDDMRLTNPATHPQLLNALTDDLVAHEYDLNHLIRQIVMSEAYRRQAPATTAESRNDLTYDFGPRKTMSPDVLLDLIDDATGSQLPNSETDQVRRAIQLEDPTTPSMTLDTLGRCARSEVCTSPSATSSLSLMLHWINGDTLNQRIESEKHWLKTILATNPDPDIVMNQMYLRTLCRLPSKPERELLLTSLHNRPPADQQAGWEDLFWALLSSRDFLDNR